jgi:hypothetical protein
MSMLEENSYWDIDILMEAKSEKKREIKRASASWWLRIWNWRKIKRLYRELEKITYINENQNKK